MIKNIDAINGNDDLNTPAKRLRHARNNAGLTQKQLANAAGVNTRLIQKLEGGETEAGNVTARNLLAIADALGVDPRDLI